MRGGTISQVEIDQGLIRDADLLCEILEVADRALIHSERDLTLELPRIGVLLCLRKIVFFSHGNHLSQYCFCSARVAFRAEMILTTSLLFR